MTYSIRIDNEIGVSFNDETNEFRIYSLYFHTQMALDVSMARQLVEFISARIHEFDVQHLYTPDIC